MMNLDATSILDGERKRLKQGKKYLEESAVTTVKTQHYALQSVPLLAHRTSKLLLAVWKVKKISNFPRAGRRKFFTGIWRLAVMHFRQRKAPYVNGDWPPA